MTDHHQMTDYVEVLAGVLRRVDWDAVDLAAEAMIGVVRAGGTIYAAGNGGSMAQADHFTGELVGRYRLERPAIAAATLGSPVNLTCVGNDYGYAETFRRQAEALVRERDALLVLSTSGRSPNVNNAARNCLGTLVAITGLGSRTWRSGAHHVVIPSSDTATIQEATLVVLHCLAEQIEAGI